MTKRFALVCCGKQKLATQAPAKEMYQSTLFKKTRRHAETQYDGWFILSALHRVMDPDQVIAPYDVTLNKQDATAWAERTAAELVPLMPKGSVVDYFGGALYQPVVALLQAAGYVVGRPLQGLQIGERLHWLKAHEVATEAGGLRL